MYSSSSESSFSVPSDIQSSTESEDDFLPVKQRKEKSLKQTKQTTDLTDSEYDSNSDFASNKKSTKKKKTVTVTGPLITEPTDENIIESVMDWKESEFLIKWKGWSHLHNTWESMEALVGLKGHRKVLNYTKQIIEPFTRAMNDPLITKDELETINFNVEIEREMLKDYATVERVIAYRNNSPSVEYLCKWKRLQYAQCTWESAETALTFQDKLDEFLNRQTQPIPHRSTNYPKATKRPQFKRMIEQPSYIKGGELRDYQLMSLNWMAYLWSKDDNGILADEMGLGKTIQTTCFLSYLYHSLHIYGPFLIVVPLSTIGSWQREIEKWAPDFNLIVYIGDGKSRKVIRDYEFINSTGKLQFNALLTTFELVMKDSEFLQPIKWCYLAVDEAHRLKNTTSLLYETLYSFNISNRLLITGTPLQNNITELAALIQFLMPTQFNHYFPEGTRKYELNYTDVKQMELNIRELHDKIRPFMLRRLKKDVEKSLPLKNERILRVELSPMQEHYYKSILAKNFEILNKGVVGNAQTSLLNIAMELKKASNHPYLFASAEEFSSSKEEQLHGLITNSGKMVLLDMLLKRLFADGHRVLIFSQMVRMLDILSDYMSLRGYSFQRLDGTISNEDRKKSIERFNCVGSRDVAFLISTRAGGLGINLETADTVILFDSSDNPQNDVQAMARAHRIGQKNTVNVYRFISKGSIEEEIVERAKRKMVLEYCVIKQMDTSGVTLNASAANANTTAMTKAQSKKELQAILQFGAANMFKQQEKPRLDEMDLDDILARAETTNIDPEQVAVGDNFLDQFQITDYDIQSWEDIIPETERAEAKTMEMLKQELEWSQTRKRKVVSYDERDAALNSQQEKATTPSRKRGSSRTGGGGGGKVDVIDEKDERALVKAMMKFGCPVDQYNAVVEEAGLVDKVREKVLEASNAIIDACRKTLVEQGQSVNDSRKNVLFTYKGIKDLNATCLIQRVDELKHIHSHLSQLPKLYSYRFSPAPKAVQWSCQWGQKDDAMLLIGIYLYGFGSWNRIRTDPALGLQLKLFVDSSDPGDVIPKGVHLNRRGEYLIKTFVEQVGKSGGSGVEKGKRAVTPRKKREEKSSSKRRKMKAVDGDAVEDDESVEEEDEDVLSEVDEVICKQYMRPVKTELKSLQRKVPELDGQEKADLIKQCLLAIGNQIDVCLQSLPRLKQKEMEKKLWIFVCMFWPVEQEWAKIRAVYGNVVSREKQKGVEAKAEER